MSDRTAKASLPSLKLSVFARCAMLIALTTAIVATVISLRMSATARDVAIDGLRTSAGQLTTLTATQLGGAIRFQKPDDIVAQLENLIDREGSPAVSGVAVDLEGNVIASYGPLSPEVEALLVDLARSAIEDGEALYDGERIKTASAIPFGNDGATVGALAVNWSANEKLSIISAANQNSYIFSAGLFVVMLAISGFLIRQSIARPLTALRGAIQSVSQDDYSVSIPAAGRKDEIGGIATSLQDLVGKLKVAEETNRDAIFKGAGFEGSSAALALLDTDGQIIACNPAFKTFGRDIFGAENTMNVAPRDLHSDLEVVTQGAQPVDASVDVDGRKIQALSNEIRDADGDVVGTVLELAEVTDQMRNAAILDALDGNQAIAEFSPDGKLIDSNEAFASALGASKTSLEGRGATSLQPMGSDPLIAQACTDQKSLSGSFVMARDDGTEAFLDGMAFPILDDTGKVFRVMIIGTDTTESTLAVKKAEATRIAMTEDQSRVVERLKLALEQLSVGDLTSTIDEAFPDDYESLRIDFNAAVEKLDVAMASVVENARLIKGETSEISKAAEDLSKRTEHQAATLEETAAALTEITASVSSAAEGARQADQVVTDARANAEDSGVVVRQAVEAMEQIAQSSDQISRIIGVIDDIAFQTNLLALNAGVEAARAGDAGRGFAVVASEVRALAQRSSDAASEINDLITTSGQQVSRGVDLVGNAGKALTGIVDSVEGISGYVSAISASSQEQSAGLQEINTAMSQLDQVTQQNAAMFEETTAASHALTQEALALSTTTDRFKTSALPSASVISGPPAKTATATESHSERPRASSPSSDFSFESVRNEGDQDTDKTFKKAVGDAQPLSVATDEDDWEDF